MQQPKTTFDVTYTTLAKVFIFAIFAYTIVKLVPFILFLLLAVLVGVSLIPVVEYAGSLGIPKKVAEALVSLLLVASIFSVIVFLVPAVVDQVSAFIKRIPEFQKQLEESISSETIRNKVHQFFVNAPEKIGNDAPDKIVLWGQWVISAAYHIGLLTILSIYVMLDGHRALEWFLHFFSASNQQKIRKTAGDGQAVILSYVFAQFTTCLFVAVYTFAANTLLHIPGAVLLATVATICDLIPVIGFIISLSVAVLIALTVSTSKAMIIGILYVVYSLIENYVIVPNVYGQAMKLSKLAVLLSILIGGELAGVEGMLLALPVAGSFTIIEKYWMHQKKIRSEKVESHA